MAHNRFKPTLKDVRYVRTIVDKLKPNGLWILPAWGLQYQKVGENRLMLLKERVPPIIPSTEDFCDEEEIIERTRLVGLLAGITVTEEEDEAWVN